MKKIVCMAILAMSTLCSYAATLTVTNTNDAGAGSLRDQVGLAMAGDTITFSPTLNGQTITLTTGGIAFAKSLVILGPGYNLLTINGNLNSRIFFITAGDVVIRGLKIINCLQDDVIDNDGGAILHTNAGTLVLGQMYFENNTAVNNNGSQGGAVFYGVSGGSVRLDSCIFKKSRSDNFGGTVSFNGGPNFVTIHACLFDSSSSMGSKSTLFTNTRNLMVTNSTFSNATGPQQVIFDGGGNSEFDDYTFINCTFSNNIAQIPGSNFEMEEGTIRFINCTFVGNNEPIEMSGHSVGDAPTFITQNTIYANTGLNFIASGEGDILQSLGGNILNDTSMNSFLNGTNDLNDTIILIDPMLAYNGGFTPTHKLISGSLAINNGVNLGAPVNDQSGAARTGTYDAGSMEYVCPLNAGTATITACDSLVWIDGITYTSSNNTATYTVAGVAADACDSIITLNLTIINSSSNSLTATACDSYTLNGQTYTSSGTYTQMLTNADGCDSTLTLNLTIDNVDVTVTQNANTLTAVSGNDGYQWINCNGNTLINNETQASYTASANGSYAVIVTNGSCVDTSTCATVAGLSIAQNDFGASLQVFPNPTKGAFSVHLGAVYTNVVITVIDLQGRTVMTQQFASGDILPLVLDAPAGVYNVMIHAEPNKNAVVRMIKQ